MMFRKKQKPIERYWEDKDYMEVRTIRDMYELNESQKRLGLVNGGEYEQFRQDILKMIQQVESKNAFDQMMGDPMNALEGMFND